MAGFNPDNFTGTFNAIRRNSDNLTGPVNEARKSNIVKKAGRKEAAGKRKEAADKKEELGRKVRSGEIFDDIEAVNKRNERRRSAVASKLYKKEGEDEAPVSKVEYKVEPEPEPEPEPVQAASGPVQRASVTVKSSSPRKLELTDDVDGGSVTETKVTPEYPSQPQFDTTRYKKGSPSPDRRHDVAGPVGASVGEGVSPDMVPSGATEEAAVVDSPVSRGKRVSEGGGASVGLQQIEELKKKRGELSGSVDNLQGAYNEARANRDEAAEKYTSKRRLIGQNLHSIKSEIGRTGRNTFGKTNAQLAYLYDNSSQRKKNAAGSSIELDMHGQEVGDDVGAQARELRKEVSKLETARNRLFKKNEDLPADEQERLGELTRQLADFSRANALNEDAGSRKYSQEKTLSMKAAAKKKLSDFLVRQYVSDMRSQLSPTDFENLRYALDTEYAGERPVVKALRQYLNDPEAAAAVKPGDNIWGEIISDIQGSPTSGTGTDNIRRSFMAEHDGILDDIDVTLNKHLAQSSSANAKDSLSAVRGELKGTDAELNKAIRDIEGRVVNITRPDKDASGDIHDAIAISVYGKDGPRGEGKNVKLVGKIDGNTLKVYPVMSGTFTARAEKEFGDDNKRIASFLEGIQGNADPYVYDMDKYGGLDGTLDMIAKNLQAGELPRIRFNQHKEDMASQMTAFEASKYEGMNFHELVRIGGDNAIKKYVNSRLTGAPKSEKTELNRQLAALQGLEEKYGLAVDASTGEIYDPSKDKEGVRDNMLNDIMQVQELTKRPRSEAGFEVININDLPPEECDKWLDRNPNLAEIKKKVLKGDDITAYTKHLKHVGTITVSINWNNPRNVRALKAAASVMGIEYSDDDLTPIFSSEVKSEAMRLDDIVKKAEDLPKPVIGKLRKAGVEVGSFGGSVLDMEFNGRTDNSLLKRTARVTSQGGEGYREWESEKARDATKAATRSQTEDYTSKTDGKDEKLDNILAALAGLR